MHAMKAIAIIVVLLLVVVNALELLPAASAFQMYLSGGAVALSLVALIAILVGRGPSRDNRRAGAEAARPMPVTTRANQADAEIVSFLAMLQARGRLVDFLMDDINAHDDAQVGAAARVVHSGCKTALLEHFRISPCAQRARDRRCRSPLAIRRTSTDCWARSAARRRSRECLSTTAGKRMP
jgi:hypothetical protein